jgi:eukaryotic-like serine/threonine-protein kinase
MMHQQLMTELKPYCGETVLRFNASPSARASVAPRSFELQEITPARLADLMVAAPILRGASLVSLQPEGDTSKLLVRRGSATLTELRVPAEIGNAAVARIAFLAGLDPFAAAGSLQGSANVARLRARSGRHAGEVLVSVVAQSSGFEAEIRPLMVNGRAPDLHVLGRLKRCRRCRAFQAPARQTCALDGGALEDIEDAPIPGGTVGPYRVLSHLGQGGVGAVFAGEHALLERPVAIKLLHRSFASNPRLVRRFLSEARAASRLHHPNIVDVTDFGLLADGRPYMVMERLDGESLEARLLRVGALEPVVALQIAREMVLGLCAAHQAGVTHNDLKPSNVMLLDAAGEPAPRLKLIDFGAASVVGTPEELVFGTPGYMAPERLFNEPSDGRADVYAIGMILYEMLKGGAPFKDLPQEALILAHVQQPLPPLDSPFGLLPLPVIGLVARAVAKKADGRHQSAAEMLADIDHAISSLRPQGWRRWLP